MASFIWFKTQFIGCQNAPALPPPILTIPLKPTAVSCIGISYRAVFSNANFHCAE